MRHYYPTKFTSGVLPEEYTIPKFHGPSSPRDYDDNYFFLIKPNRLGYPSIETKEGITEIKNIQEVLSLFKFKYNWTFSRLNEMDCLFKYFTKKQLMDLKWFGVIDLGEFQIHWLIGTQKIRLTKNNSSQSSKYIINTAPYTTIKKVQEVDMDLLKKIVDQLIGINQYIPINPVSPASTVKDLVLSVGNREFNLFNRLPLKFTRYLHSGYIGPRMESRFIGTAEGLDNLDMQKAYLRKLGELPSLDSSNIVKVVGGIKKIVTRPVHPGSVYTIKVTVPSSYSQFAPLPVRSNGLTPYPQGTFVTRVSKPFLDTLEEIGDVPFQILDSIQIVLRDDKFKPFAGLSEFVEKAEEYLQNVYPLINLKSFHYSVTGHMLRLNEKMDKETGDISYEASQDYNPVNANAVAAMVATELWKLSQANKTEAIRIDALTGSDLPSLPGFKKEGTGLMTFLTPSLKDKPGETIYRDLINRFRDGPYVPVKFPFRTTIEMAYCNPTMIGRLKDRKVDLYPEGGNREPTYSDSKKVTRIGNLLDSKIMLPVPVMDIGDKDLVPARRDLAWMDDYLKLFPQT